MPIKAKHNGSYKDITDLMNVDESIDYVLAKTSSSYKRVYTATRSIEDAPPTTFKSIKPGANLTDYRIYGQTSRNLFSSRIEQGSFDASTGALDGSRYRVRSHADDYIYLLPGNYELSASGVDYSVIYGYDSPDVNTFNSNLSRDRWVNLPSTITINTSAYYKFGFRRANNPAITPSDISNIMLNSGSTPLPYEPYGESVGDRTANLFDGNWLQGYWKFNTGEWNDSSQYIATSIIDCTPNTDYTFSLTGKPINYGFIWYNQAGRRIASNYDHVEEGGSPTHYTATSPASAAFMAVNISREADKTTIVPQDVTDFMLVEGSVSSPYEPYGYKVPVTVTNNNNSQTTNLYLPEQIRKVGYEAEYIDYGEQKFVKKFYKLTLNFDDMNNEERYPGWQGGTALVEYCNKIRSSAIGYLDGYTPFQSSSISNFRAMFAVSRSILFLGAASSIGHTQSELKEIYAGQSITFILKIPDIDLDVTLPALPTLPGTNTLSVGTEVQPSKIDITGHIKTISGGS